MSINKSKYAFQLKLLRKEYNVSQCDIADALQISPSTVFNWENEFSSPSGDMLVRLADFFEIPMDWFYGRVWNPNTYSSMDVPAARSSFLRRLSNEEKEE